MFFVLPEKSVFEDLKKKKKLMQKKLFYHALQCFFYQGNYKNYFAINDKTVLILTQEMSSQWPKKKKKIYKKNYLIWIEWTPNEKYILQQHTTLPIKGSSIGKCLVKTIQWKRSFFISLC